MEEQRKESTTTSTDTKETDNKSTGGRTGGRNKKGESNSKPTEENLVTTETPKIVEVEIPVIDEKEEKKATPKKRSTPKKKGKKNDKKKEGVDPKDLSMMIQGIFGIASLRLGGLWQVSEDESKSIAEPLARILDRMEISDKFEGASDGIVLAIATTSVILPRVLVTTEFKKQKKKDILSKNGVMKDVASDTEVSRPDVANSKEGTANVGQLIKSLHTDVY